jgi:hypothetical protein
MKLQLISNGDSWVFGSELVHPDVIKKYPSNIHIGRYDFLPENDNYRLPRIFTTKLANKLNAESINLARPADDNQSICNRTISYITENYIGNGLSTNNLFVVIGWSSPERACFWYKDETRNGKHIIWPSLQWHDTPSQKKFWELYVTYFWNKEEYIPRFVDTVLRFQNFCSEHNIKHVMFNAFYQGGGSGCTRSQSTDINIEKELSSLLMDRYEYTIGDQRFSKTSSHLPIWKTINDKTYYCKDHEKNSFKTFIYDRLERPFAGDHPSEEGHTLWADELYNYINKYNLL